MATNWKILKDLGILDHLTCLLSNLYVGQEATVKNLQRTIDWLTIGKGVTQDCILSPYLLNLYAEYIMWNAVLNESQPRIKIAGRNINNFRYVDDMTLMAEIKEELKSFLMRVKEESKSCIKTQHSKNKDHGMWPYHFMANRYRKSGNCDRFYFGGAPKSLWIVTAATKLKGACSLEEKL